MKSAAAPTESHLAPLDDGGAALNAGNSNFFPRVDVAVALEAERYQILSGIVSELTSGSYMVDL